MTRGSRGLLLAVSFVPATVWGQITNLESLSSTGVQGTNWSQDVRMSGDGRWLAFSSAANNLVAGDLGGADVFIRDRSLGMTTRISTTPTGAHAGGNHYRPDMTPDGRFVVWDSDSTSVLGIPTVGRQVVIRDRDSDGNGVFDDAGGMMTELVSANVLGLAPLVGQSIQASVSADGRFVAFVSEASDLVTADLNGVSDVFLRDRANGTTVCVSRGLNGLPGTGGLSNAPSISRDGRYVLFQSNATNLVPGDTNGTTDVFRYAVETGAVDRVSVAWDGSQLAQSSVVSVDATLGPCMSADGRHIVFQTIAPNMLAGDSNGAVDVFARDLVLGTNTRMSVRWDGGQIPGISQSGIISGTGRFVVFGSAVGGIVPGDNNSRSDVFVHDRDTDGNGVFDEPGTTSVRRVSLSSTGVEGTNASFGGRISDDGQRVAFVSASALVTNDTNGFPDVYFHTAPSERCPADWDGSTGVDSDDVVLFFSDWNLGEADVDHSGSTDSDDIVIFFVHWDVGC